MGVKIECETPYSGFQVGLDLKILTSGNGVRGQASERRPRPYLLFVGDVLSGWSNGASTIKCCAKKERASGKS